LAAILCCVKELEGCALHNSVDAIGSNEMQEPNCKIFQIIPYLANYSGSYLVNYSASYLANYFGSTLANYSGMS
jgi:hypothetical protein